MDGVGQEQGLWQCKLAMLGTPQGQDAPPLLNCLIEGESNVFPIAVRRDYAVGEFRRVIQEERALDTLEGVGPHTLELWKVSAIGESLCKVTSLFSAQGLQPYCCGAPKHSG